MVDIVPGNNSSTYSLALGTAVTGRIDTESDQDWYRINLTAGQTYTIRQWGSGTDPLLDTYVRVYNSSGTQLSFNDDGALFWNGSNFVSTRNSQLNFTASTSGTYYVAAGAFETTASDYLGDYTITASVAGQYATLSTSQIADYLIGGYWVATGRDARAFSGHTVTVNIAGLDTDGQMLARAAWATWEQVASIDFVESTSASAQIILTDDGAGRSAGANSSVSGTTILSSTINITRGWLDYYGTSTNSYSFETYIHEFGHAIGLGHAGPYNGSVNGNIVYQNDTTAYTIMSYLDSDPTSYVLAPQSADIIAIQTLYGSPWKFGAPTFEIAAFGYGAGSWSSDDQYPRMLADVNGDGRADIVGFGYAGAIVSLATGNGHFAAPTLELSAFGYGAGSWSSDGKYPRELADVNGDGRADIVGFGYEGVIVSLATGGGHFAAPTLELRAFAYGAGSWSSDDKYPRELADVNGDGRADIVGFGHAGTYVSLATGGGHFANPTFELAAFAYGAGGWSSDDQYPRMLGDVNGDGRADIVGFGYEGAIVSLATGNGHFAAPTLELRAFGYGAGSWSSDDKYPRELADVNGDGKADIIGFGYAGVYVSLATGGGHFANPTFERDAFAYGAGSWSSDNKYPREVADVTGDGKADIVGFGYAGVITSVSGWLV